MNSENAKIFVNAVCDALARGVKHYDVRGKQLSTVREVLEALLNDGRIEFEKPDTGERPK